MQKTKKEIINETAEFYGTDPTRRATCNEEGRATCRYLTKDGRKCAVGRCFIHGKKIIAKRERFSAEDFDAPVYDISNINSLLLPEYRGFNADFWRELQLFHDDNGNFNAEGLSKQGIETKQYLLTKFAE